MFARPEPTIIRIAASLRLPEILDTFLMST